MVGSGVTGDSTSGLRWATTPLTITDSLGCTATRASFLIEANGALPVTMDSTAISCHPRTATVRTALPPPWPTALPPMIGSGRVGSPPRPSVCSLPAPTAPR
ncbi:MAG: hypothetical protein R2788_17035 [Saprospiraceae bacterium]